jgi:hypothetical protein
VNSLALRWTGIAALVGLTMACGGNVTRTPPPDRPPAFGIVLPASSSPASVHPCAARPPRGGVTGKAVPRGPSAAVAGRSSTPPPASPPHLRELTPSYPPAVVKYLYEVRDCADAVFNASFARGVEHRPTNDSIHAKFMAAALLSIDGETGALTAVSITRSSGDRDFDARYLASLRGAFPMTPPPRELLSEDGRGYVRWEVIHDRKKGHNEYAARAYKFEVAASAPFAVAPPPAPNPGPTCGYGSMPPSITLASLTRYPAAPRESAPVFRSERALGSSRVAFATYLNAVHNCIHPVFADRFVASLDGLPKSDPLFSGEVSAHVRLSVDGLTGNLLLLELTRSSGDPRFDAGVVASIRSAFPIAPTPARAIWSSDGVVYMDWELHRDPNNACSTYFSRPRLFT